jgi:tyrosyl-tRNA synthetase
LLGLGRWPELAAQAAALEAGSGDPLALKQALAARVVERFHGSTAALDAAEHFRRVVQERLAPADVPSMTIELPPNGTLPVLDLLMDAFGLRSKSECRRLIAEKAVRVDESLMSDPLARLPVGDYLVQVGRRRFVRVKLLPRS